MRKGGRKKKEDKRSSVLPGNSGRSIAGNFSKGKSCLSHKHKHV